MEFLQFVQAIAANITPSNIESMVNLVEELVSLGENMLEHNTNSAASTTPPTQS
jgi:hypothetical protein